MIFVVLSRPSSPSLVSWLIRKITGFDASHATIHMVGRGLFKDQRLVLEASGKRGVSIVHSSIWDTHNRPIYIYCLVKKQEQGALAVGKMWELLGESYDLRGLLSFAWRLILKKLFGVSTKVHASDDMQFCSELVARWLNALAKQVGSPLPRIPPDATAPKDLLAIMRGMNLFEEVSCESLSLAICTSAPPADSKESTGS